MIDDPLIGYQLGAYRIERLIGRGGMAQVYYGTDLNLQRAVAVKVIDTRFRNDPAYAQRLVQEARVVAAWRHENILQVYAAGEDSGLYYFVMEYIDGLDLGQIMAGFAKDKELMPLADVLRIGKAVADALDYAHHRQVIHRDVKPSNVMVAKDGRIVLMDFGLALNVQQGSLGETFGTPHYIAPEQAVNSAQAVPQSDVYALGVILYEMLTGAVPFNDPSTMAVIMQHITLPPPSPRLINPNLNLATETVLLKTLSKKPADRYQSSTALVEALAKAIAEPETAVSAASPSAEPSFLAAPPLPAGMKPTPPRPISRQTVAERVSLYQPPPIVAPVQKVATPPLTPAQPPPISKPISPPPAKIPGWLLVVGGVVLFLLVAWGIASLLVEDETESAVSATPSPFSTATELIVLAPTEPPTAEPSAPTATADTPPATETAVPTTLPTETSTVVATETAVPASPTLPPVAAPTVLYPNGKRIMLLYDANSFYLWNSTSERIAIRSIDFENIDANGNFAGYFFDGSLWTQFYSYVEDQSCVRIELLRAPAYLRPPLCRDYNATVTPDPDDDAVFWLPRPGITQFRVLWDNQEIARCEASAGQCELFLP